MNYPHLDGTRRFQVEARKSALGHFRGYFEAARFRRLGKAIKDWNPDIVLLNKEVNLADWMSHEISAPVVPYLHGHLELEARLARATPAGDAAGDFGSNPRKAYLRLAGMRNIFSTEPGRCKQVICVSNFAAAQLERYWPNVKTKVVHNGVDHSKFFPTWEDEQYLLCISRIVGHKNLMFLVDAFRSSDHPLIIYGNLEQGSSRGREYLQKLESAKGPRTQIVLHKDEKQLVGLLQRASVFLHPGKDEGFALAPLEAMACGKPVIAHDSGGTPELIGSHGLLIGDDREEWKAAADRLMNSKPLRVEMGRDAYDYSRNFTWEKTSQELESVLESLD
jgi:glycosyltransferase involved in cell wall biosynthesis